jgi:hypothetical protein
MGPGSHVGFPISAKNKNLVYDHPMNISAKFGSNLFCGFQIQELPVAAMFVNRSGQMSNHFRGTSIDASYHVSIHLDTV